VSNGGEGETGSSSDTSVEQQADNLEFLKSWSAYSPSPPEQEAGRGLQRLAEAWP
jgi:hypothetical protein